MRIKNFLILFLISNIAFFNTQKVNSNEQKINSSTLDKNYLKNFQDFEYILGPGDLIQIIISREIPELTGNYLIDSTGKIIVPKLKNIYVAGLTTSELSALLQEKYLDYIQNPNLEITIQKYRPIKVYVEGEVQNPGLYVMRIPEFDKVDQNTFVNYPESGFTSSNSIKNLSRLSRSERDFKKFNYTFPTVYDSIKKAGGITLFSDLENISLVRSDTLSNGGGKVKTELNLLSMLEKGNNSQNINLMDGDYIKINKSSKPLTEQLKGAFKSNLNPKIITVYVTGRVAQPGRYQIPSNYYARDAVQIAGGARVIKGKAELIRTYSDGTVTRNKINVSSKSKKPSLNNPKLKDGDIISIGKNVFNVAGEILTDLTSPVVQTYGFIKIFED